MVNRAFRFISDRLKRLPSAIRAQRLSAWFLTPAGQKILAMEKKWLAEQLGHCWGETLLHVMLNPELINKESKQRIRCLLQILPEGVSEVVAVDASELLSPLSVIADVQSWPVENESIPIVLLHHSVELAVDIHQLLREAARVLIPGGHLIILSFNPLSRWGIIRLLRAGSGKAPWVGEILSSYRLLDWLRLLNFDAELSQPGGFCYGIFARKRSIPLTPDLKRWHALTALMPMPKKQIVAQIRKSV